VYKVRTSRERREWHSEKAKGVKKTACAPVILFTIDFKRNALLE
jgi:hypothetical protein